MEPENSKDGGQSLSHKTNEHKKPVHNNTTFGLNCIYLNADSLLNKRDELRAVVSQTEPDIIAITEVLPKNTRTPVQPSELRLEGYNLFWNSNPRRGVCIYSKSSLKCDEVDINVDGAQESVWISTQLAGQDKLLIGCMYPLADSGGGGARGARPPPLLKFQRGSSNGTLQKPSRLRRSR